MYPAQTQVVSLFSAMLLIGGVSSINAPIEGYGVQDITWSMTHTPGAPPEEYSGTIEQVMSSVLEKNPNFYNDFGIEDRRGQNHSHPGVSHPGYPGGDYHGYDRPGGSQSGSNHPGSGHPNTDYVVKKSTRGLLEKRDSVNCDPRHGEWIFTYLEPIVEGISYLRGVPGSPSNGPGPGNCGRVSCSYESAIWWCNDVSHAER